MSCPHDVLPLPAFDPAALLWRLRSECPGMPLIHIDREQTTGWSHVPIRFDRILEDGPEGVRCFTGEGLPMKTSASGWDDHPIFKRPPRQSGADKRPSPNESVPPFSAGVILLLPFEMAEHWEPSGGPFTAPGVPAYRADCAEVVSWHAPTGRLFLPKGFDRRLLSPVSFDKQPSVALSPVRSRSGFSRMFKPIREGLERGDYFQVNIALRFHAPAPEGFDPLAVYARMLSLSRARYGGFFSFRSRFVLSHSPEQLLSLSSDRILTRPIAGTAPGASPSGDVDPLLRDPKLLAEHIMTVDLLRNDIGRVSRTGTVTVPTLLSVENYPHLRHLVSEVRGVIDPRHSRAAVIRALFPGGSVTGAPRIRVRREIGLLEEAPRNYYCGTLGFLSEKEEGDFALLIRTLEGEDGPKGRLVFGAGAGIVADSDEEEEYGEIWLKARGMGEVLS